MKDYFESVEFPELEEKKEVIIKNPLEEDLKGELTRAFAETRRLFAAVRTGESNIRRGAVMLKANDPCMISFQHLQAAATRENLYKFLLLCKQDIGSAAAIEILRIFVGVDPKLKGVINI